MPSDSFLCGTDIEFEDFRSGGTAVGFSRALPEGPQIEGLEIPCEDSFEGLVSTCRTKTADEIFSIFSNREAEARYGSANAVIRNVASSLEAVDPELSYGVHSRNWQEFRDSHSLLRLIPLALRLGRRADSMKYARIARYLGENVDPYVLLSHSPLKGSETLVEAVLSGAITQDPDDVRYLLDNEVERYMNESRAIETEALRGLDIRSKEAWEIRLRALEFRGLTLLDPVSVGSYVRLLAKLANASADFDGDSKVFLSEFAVSGIPLVSEAHYSHITGENAIVDDDRTSVAELLFRRLGYVMEHFLDPRFIELHRAFQRLFEALGYSPGADTASSNVAILKKQGEFFSSLPESARTFRNRLLRELSCEYGSAYFPRVRCRVF